MTRRRGRCVVPDSVSSDQGGFITIWGGGGGRAGNDHGDSDGTSITRLTDQIRSCFWIHQRMKSIRLFLPVRFVHNSSSQKVYLSDDFDVRSGNVPYCCYFFSFFFFCYRSNFIGFKKATFYLLFWNVSLPVSNWNFRSHSRSCLGCSRLDCVPASLLKFKNVRLFSSSPKVSKNNVLNARRPSFHANLELVTGPRTFIPFFYDVVI